jgi:glycosyltransferase involved in cell wall biosynthesis
MDRLRAEAPATVVTINFNQIDHLEAAPGLTFVFDGFAPRLLEREHRDPGTFPAGPLQRLEEQKLRALQLCDAVIVNGHRKVDYYRSWLERAGRGDEAVPLRVVEMPVAPAAPDPVPGPLRVAVAGYLQPWSPPGPWLDVLGDHLDDGLEADAVVARHWGGAAEAAEMPEVARFLAHPRVTVHPPLRFGEFGRLLSRAHLAIDLFPRTREREYAMVTRTVVALASGLPVIHPPFTEVSPLIEEYGAGWLLEEGDLESLVGVLDTIRADRSLVSGKAAGARRLAAERLDPPVAVRPLVEIIESAGPKGGNPS